MPQTLPTTVNAEYLAGAIAPHAPTVRWTYTVPASRFAVIESLEVYLARDSAAGANALAAAYIDLLPSGGTRRKVLYAPIHLLDVGTHEGFVWGGRLLLGAGDVLRGVTEDFAAAGTVLYALLMKGSEYVL